MKWNESMGWAEDVIKIDDRDVEIFYMPASRSTNTTAAEKFFNSLDFPDIVKKAKDFAIKHALEGAEEWCDLPLSEIKEKLNTIKVNGITAYKNSVDFYFNDAGIYGEHTFVISYDKNGKFDFLLEG